MTWLKRKHNWCSPVIQNEMLQLLVNELMRSIHAQNPVMYCVICNGIHGVSGKEQICICLRYVDEILSPVERSVGLYDTDSTTSEAISNIIFYVLIRLQLSVAHLRGQAYDGASNMSGHKRGVQSLVKEQQQLAPFIHCGAHSANLVIQDSCGASYVIKNSLQLAHNIGVLFSQSLNARHELKKLMKLDSGAPHKTLMSNAMGFRRSQIDGILQNYGLLLDTLEQLKVEKNSHAHGLLEKLE
ncbi:hypothetical protein PR048_024608 [Dryococelus australis]|uniref:DUF4371 domain-containing protein n=1 Tax=Dryococelus australis TaxID=614101 RepID=A0ABQ9GP30_9NEOP|nr:hypothetical protein PR048_024608 [Dryococelus australis]